MLTSKPHGRYQWPAQLAPTPISFSGVLANYSAWADGLGSRCFPFHLHPHKNCLFMLSILGRPWLVLLITVIFLVELDYDGENVCSMDELMPSSWPSTGSDDMGLSQVWRLGNDLLFHNHTLVFKPQRHWWWIVSHGLDSSCNKKFFGIWVHTIFICQLHILLHLTYVLKLEGHLIWISDVAFTLHSSLLQSFRRKAFLPQILPLQGQSSELFVQRQHPN